MERSAWKDITINSFLHKINGVPLRECISKLDEDDEDNIDDDTNTFKATIRYLQRCPLPTKITFKIGDEDDDGDKGTSSSSGTMSSLIAPFLEMPKVPLFEMKNAEFVDYLETNWKKQSKIHSKFKDHPVFKQKYGSFLSLIEVVQNNMDSFDEIASRLREVEELRGDTLSKYTFNQSMLLQIVMKAFGSTKDGNDSGQKMDFWLNHLSIWIFNIVEVLRVDHNKEYNLFHYLSDERPRSLIETDIENIRKMDNAEFIQFASSKLSEVGNDVFREQWMSFLENMDFDGMRFAEMDEEQMVQHLIAANGASSEFDIRKMVKWLHAMIHDVRRIETPIFDHMMLQRDELKRGLLSDDDHRIEGEEDDDDDVDEAMMISKEFEAMKRSVDKRLKRRFNPPWTQHDDEFEQEFVVKFLNERGFAEHSDKFHSMSCLSKMKNAQLRKFEMCAKHRKSLLRHVNKWNEIQNIIKYGKKPYYRSNGYDRSSLPSFGQCYGEMGPLKSNRNFNPAEDQTKTTKMFYVPFVKYSDLHQMVKHNRKI